MIASTFLLVLHSLIILFLQHSGAAGTEHTCSEDSIQDFVTFLAPPGPQQQVIEETTRFSLCSSSSELDGLQRSRAACQISEQAFSQTIDGNRSPAFLNASSPLYPNRIEQNWSDNCWQNASCIISPMNSAEVARALRIISYCGSKFSVRSGGHNYNVNSSSVGTDGVLVDTVNINRVSLSDDQKTFDIGPAVPFGDAYKALSGTGVSINGARALQPSAGGFFLGAGFGWFINNYGLAATSLRSAEVILSNSSIVECNQNQNADLFWAIKGGGPNFGIVTRYTVNTIPVDQLWFESRLYDASQIDRLINATMEWQVAAANDGNANLVVSLTSTLSFVGFIYAQPVERPPIFDAFYNIPFNSSAANSTIGTMYDLSNAYAALSNGGDQHLRHLAVSVAHQPDLNVYGESFNDFLDISSQVQEFQGELSYGVQTVTPNAIATSHAQGGPAFELSNITQNWFVGTLQWEDPANDTAAYAAIQALGASVRSASERHNVALPFIYMNDANQMQDVFGGYGQLSVDRLKSISSEYDPAQTFQLLQNGGWVLNPVTT